VTFAGGKCTIRGLDGKHVGAVLRMAKGLYWVAHDEPNLANMAEEELTLDQFCCHMGQLLLEWQRSLSNRVL
jgi:hypothetical protein